MFFKKKSYSDSLWDSIKKACKQVEKGKQRSARGQVTGATVQEVVSKLGDMYSREEIMGELTRRNNPDKPMFEGELKPDTILNLK